MNFSVLKRPSIFMASAVRQRRESTPEADVEARRESIFDLLFLLRRNSSRPNGDDGGLAGSASSEGATGTTLAKGRRRRQGKTVRLDEMKPADQDDEPVVTSA